MRTFPAPPDGPDPDVFELLRRLPDGWALAPIFRIGKQGSDDGKKPVSDSRMRLFDAEECAGILQSDPDTYGAVGVWLGPRSMGLVCLDIDHENGVAHILAKYGEDALPVTFCVSSPRTGRFKLFYLVPTEYWERASNISLKATGGMYELLWRDKQGIILGAYATGGCYRWVEGVESLCEAPRWLIRELTKETRETAFLPEGFSTGTQLSEEEKEQIVIKALEYLPNEDLFYDDWFAVACAVHDALPNERGLELFEQWSAKSGKHKPGYAERRCWRYISPRQDGYHLGSLIYWCREKGFDPVPADLNEKFVETVQQRTRTSLSYEELMERIAEIHRQEDPGKVLYDLLLLGKDTGLGRKDLISVYEQYLSYSSGSAPMDAPRFLALHDPDKFSFVVPDLLAQGVAVLLHGESDAGKTYLAYHLAKAVLDGAQFKGYKARRGNVLLLQSDENPTITSQRLQQLGLGHQRGLVIVRGWQFSQELRLKAYLDKFQPTLCIIDSLSSCNSASMVSENDAAFAQPLYRLTREVAPSSGCSFLIIHHDNKTGEFRGSSAIKAAVDEMWHYRKPTAVDTELDFRTQRILRISKSRTQVSGQWAVTFDPVTSEFSAWEDYISPDQGVSDEDQIPATPQDRVRAWFESRLSNQFYSVGDLQADYGNADLVENTVRGSIRRLLQRGILEKKQFGHRDTRYRAVRLQIPEGSGAVHCADPSPHNSENPDGDSDSANSGACTPERENFSDLFTPPSL